MTTIPSPPKPPKAPKDETRLERCKRLSDFYTLLYDDVPILTSQQLLAMMKDDENVLLVDVRTNDETQVSMLPGAMTMHEFEAGIHDSTKTVVVYCTVGYRSGFHARRWQSSERSAQPIYNLDGILAWAHQQGPLVDPTTREPTNRVHTYSAKWDCLHPDYRAVFNTRSSLVAAWMARIAVHYPIQIEIVGVVAALFVNKLLGVALLVLLVLVALQKRRASWSDKDKKI
jgi:rhodanese-related sulfurtransferase